MYLSTFDSHAPEDSFQQLDIVKWYEYDSKHKGWRSVFVAESWPWCCGCGFNGSLRPSSLRLPNCGAKAAVAQYNVFNHTHFNVGLSRTFAPSNYDL